MSRVWLAVEFAALFFGLVGGYALIGSPGSPIPLLVVFGLAAVVYLRRQASFDRANLWRAAALRSAWPRMLTLWAVVAVVMVAAIAVLMPDKLSVCRAITRRSGCLWRSSIRCFPCTRKSCFSELF